MRRLILLICIVGLICCGKSKSGNSLIGKWRLIEVYNGQTVGGCACWNSVPTANADELEFYLTGSWELRKSLLSSATGCWGTYHVISDSILSLEEKCGPGTGLIVDHKYVLNLDELIIDYQLLPSGLFRYKYRRM